MNAMPFIEFLERLEPIFTLARFAAPILLIGLGFWLCRCLIRSDEIERPQSAVRQYTPGAAEPDSSFKHAKKSWTLSGKVKGAITFLISTATAVVILADEIRDYRTKGEVPRASAPINYRSPDLVKFEKFMGDAEASLSIGDRDAAKDLYLKALNLQQIAMKDAAAPLNGLARLLIEESRFDAAEPLAFIAARLDTKDPAYVNSYAEILIETCRLSAALDVLKGLELDQDVESLGLIERAQSKRDDCSD